MKPTQNHGAVVARGHAYAVGLFLLCFAFSYLDRQVVSILVAPLKSGLSLSDFQIGMLQGLSFTLCYATAGVFVARLVDRSNRVRLIAACVAIWAISTALCATASSFTELLIYRAGTAVAEAALSPAVLSVFADYYTPRQLSRPVGVFMLGPYLGSGIALIAGGLLVGWLQAGNLTLLGLTLASWQWVFLIFGVTGLPLAVMVALTLREPARRERSEQGDVEVTESAPSLREVLRTLMVDNPFCLPYFLGYTSLILLFYSLTAWFPTVLMRHFGLVAAEVGPWTGTFYMTGGILGVFFASTWARRARSGQMLNAALRAPAWACAALVPLTLAAPLVNFSLAVVLYGVSAFAASVVMALAPLPLQMAIPNRMRGRSIALLVFMTNAVGGGLGPSLVGEFGELMKDHVNGLGLALAMVAAVAAASAAALYAASARRVSIRTTLVAA
jgi:MFS family permease